MSCICTRCDIIIPFAKCDDNEEILINGIMSTEYSLKNVHGYSIGTTHKSYGAGEKATQNRTFIVNMSMQKAKIVRKGGLGSGSQNRSQDRMHKISQEPQRKETNTCTIFKEGRELRAPSTTRDFSHTPHVYCSPGIGRNQRELCSRKLWECIQALSTHLIRCFLVPKLSVC